MWWERELEPLLLCLSESAFTPVASHQQPDRGRRGGAFIKIHSHGPVMEVTLSL